MDQITNDPGLARSVVWRSSRAWDPFIDRLTHPGRRRVTPFDHCLARAIFVVNDAGILTHVEYVKEVAEHPDYDAALAAAQA